MIELLISNIEQLGHFFSLRLYNRGAAVVNIFEMLYFGTSVVLQVQKGHVNGSVINLSHTIKT